MKSLKRKNYYKNELLSLECEWASCADVFEKVQYNIKDTILKFIIINSIKVEVEMQF